MTDVLTSTTGLTQEMQTYYDKVFLERLEYNTVYDVLAEKQSIPANAGKVVTLTRQTPFAAALTALTEGTNPSAAAFSAANVTATVAEYGNVAKVTSLFSLTSIDKGLKEKVETMGQNAGETIDTLIRNELFTGATVQYAGSKAALTAVAATDTMSVVEMRKATKTLKQNRAPKFSDGWYKAVLSTQAVYDLQGDSNQGNFVAVNTYKNPDMIKKGEIGRIGGAIVHETNNDKSESSTRTVYSNFVGGRECLRMIDVNGQGASIYYKKPGESDTSNPLNMYATLGWKIPAFVVKTLNSNWLINVKTGS